MERVQVLIDKLVQHQKQGDSIPQMLLTVQLLQQELQALQQTTKPSAGAKVSVVMPSRSTVKTVQVDVSREPRKPAVPAEPPAAPQPQPEPQLQAPPAPEPEAPAIPAPALQPAAADLPQAEQPQAEIPPAAPPRAEAEPAPERYILQQLPAEEPLPQAAMTEPVPVPAQPSLPHLPDTAHLSDTDHLPDPRFDAVAETPTLVHHQPVKEIHELIGEQRESLNDKLKQEKVELAHLLKTTPIKDLRKAIGLNDKFAFINDLFRGDESMYERSIKTINGFHILQEAEYWINRELKVKLGWNDDKEVVQHFYHLVKRRFS